MATLRHLTAAAVVLVAGCGAPSQCPEASAVDGGCADLTFSGGRYDELRPVELPQITQELGDARYPACNDSEPCNGPDLDGFGSTDVYLLDGVDPEQAVIGYRQGSETSVIFLRRGLDPSILAESPAEGDRTPPWLPRGR